jgi:hypothetical protein
LYAEGTEAPDNEMLKKMGIKSQREQLVELILAVLPKPPAAPKKKRRRQCAK